MVTTSEQIDRVIESLAKGSPSYSIPEPWTPELRKQIEAVEGAWYALRPVAVADP